MHSAAEKILALGTEEIAIKLLTLERPLKRKEKAKFYGLAYISHRSAKRGHTSVLDSTSSLFV